jgi:hypothetical protein
MVHADHLMRRDRSTPSSAMSIQQSVPWSRTIVHDTRREGLRLGLIVGTATWLWVALIDVGAGRPLHTFTALGGIVAFTAVHYLLNVTYAVILLSAIHGAERSPSIIIGVIFGVITLETAFAMYTSILVQSFLGNGAWIGILGGSLIATAIAIAFLARTHPLVDYVRRAEAER